MFKNPFSFTGRIRRTEYGISFIIYFVALLIISSSVQSGGAASIVGLAFIPALWFLWAQSAKRCHDRGNSGWYQIIPYYFLWLLFAKGDDGSNKYGPNPKSIEDQGQLTNV